MVIVIVIVIAVNNKSKKLLELVKNLVAERKEGIKIFTSSQKSLQLLEKPLTRQRTTGLIESQEGVSTACML